MPPRSLTIRQSLLRSLVLLIALIAVVLLATTLVAGFRAVERVSRARIEDRAERTQAELDRFFGAVRDHVLVGRGWAEAGLLDATDHVAMNRLFVPVLERTPYLSSMMVADTNGAEYLLLRDPLRPHLWTNRVVQAEAWGTRVFNRRWNTETGEVEEGYGELDYDPRRRLWFQGALETDEEHPVHWTEPVIFFVTKDPGITAGAHHTPPDGEGPTQVVAFDLLLMDISRFTVNLDVSEHGLAFVLVEDPATKALRVVGLPCAPCYPDDAAIREALVFVPPDEAVADSAAQLPPPSALQVAAVPDVVSAWNAAGRTTQPVELESGDERWWAGLRPYPLGKDTFWIAVAVPEKDFLGDLTARSIRIALVVLAAILFAVFMAFRLARRFSEPLESLARTSHRIRELNLDLDDPPSSPLAEVGELARAQQEMVSTLRSFARYVPADVVRELLRQGEVARIGGRDVDMTILFTDIAGFTNIAQGMTPVELTQHMAAYFEAMIGVLQAHGATVDKFVGDAIVAFWGAPRPQEDHAERAVRAVLACDARLQELNPIWRDEGRPPLPTRFGLACGKVLVGNIGARSRLAYTVLGDRVNLASRLEGLNKIYGTYRLVDEDVHAACGARFAWRRLDRVVVLGRSEPTWIYEILGTAETTREVLQARARRYEAAWDTHAARNFVDAVAQLEALVADGDDTPATARLLAICRDLVASPPDGAWDAVTRMDRK